MKRYIARLSSRGRLTLPVRLRKALNLTAGDKVVFVEDGSGRIVLEARTCTLADLRGIGRVQELAINDWIEDARTAREDSALQGPAAKLDR